MNYYDETDGSWSLMGIAVNVNNVDNTLQCQSNIPSVFIRLQEPVIREWVESICNIKTTPASSTTSTTTEQTTTSESTTTARPPTPSQFDCPPDNGGNGLYPNPDDCTTFYECSNGVAYFYVTIIEHKVWTSRF